MSFDVMIPFRQALEEIGRDNDTRVRKNRRIPVYLDAASLENT